MTHRNTYALLIYRTDALEPADANAERALAGHRALQAQTAAQGDLHAVAKLDAIDTARTLRNRGGVHEISDGPYLDTKEWLVGFYLLDCADLAEALAHAKRICPVDDHAIEVRPVSWRWRP